MKGKILLFVAFVACMSLFGYIKAEQGDFDTLGYDSVNGYAFWRVDSSGYLKPGVASTLDIGTSALPVRTIYAGAVTGTGAMTATTVTGTAGYFSTIVYSTAIAPGSKTIAEIGATTATYSGQFYFCSDCTDDLICIASGTSSDHEWCGNNGAKATCS